MPIPSPTLNSKRFFLTFHRYISTSSTPLAHHPHGPTAPRQYLPHRLEHPARHASTTATTSTPPTHYTLFPQTLPLGAPPSGPFTLNPRHLRTEYLRLQSAAHPDRHPGPSKSLAEGTSAHINEAYRTLLSPLLRAQYLLLLRGINLTADESASLEDEDLLEEVMEVREIIEAAESEGELEGVRSENERRIGESEGVLERAFGEDDVEGARREAVRLRYWVNIREALEGWERGKEVVLVH